VSRVFLAVDCNTGENRGFAFVTYHVRDDAERAMATLNGYGYDNLILSVQWVQAKEPRPY
jgi:translation initiation factor 3 subunit G